MSTRATVWIKQESKNESVFLFHHWDGYMLDEELDPILKRLKPHQWNVVDIEDEILMIPEYREVDVFPWDSEYLYLIDVDNRTMTKYDVGIGDKDNDFSRLNDKNVEDTWKYYSEVKFDTEETIAQLCKIQIMDIVKFCLGHLEKGEISGADMLKLEKMFDILHKE